MNDPLLTGGPAPLPPAGDAALRPAAAAPRPQPAPKREEESAAAGAGRRPEPTPEALQAAVDRINQSVNFRVEVEPARGSGLPVVTIRDRVTGEIIRQIPPKAFVSAADDLDRLRGLLFEKVA
ncbi:MAG: flagellar protein FlaG [Nitrospirae bacterium]|nr:MAG: flagellar protein FlaG [Nitrospirota bacterium]